MKFIIEYHTHLEPYLALAKAADFFSKNGYKRNSVSEPFIRGSSFGGRWAFSPKGWFARTYISSDPHPLIGSTVIVDLEVKTDGQMITGGEKKFWEKEFKNLATALGTDEYTYKSTPWPITVYMGISTFVLGLAGLFLGVFISMQLKLSIFFIPIFAITFMTSLGGAGLRIDKKIFDRKAARQNPRQADLMRANLTLPISQNATMPDNRILISKEQGISEGISDNELLALEMQMKKGISSWAVWTGIFGALNLFNSHFQSSYGLTLIIVALLSLVFPAPAMYILYGVSIIWVAASNATAGEIQWLLFAAFQVYMGIKVLLDYKKFAPIWKTYQSNLNNPDKPQPGKGMQRSAGFFPWIGFVLSGIGAVGCIALVITLFVLNDSIPDDSPIFFALDLMIDFGMLGFAIGLASLLAGYKKSVLSIITMIFSSFIILIWVGMVVLSILANTLELQTGWIYYFI